MSNLLNAMRTKFNKLKHNAKVRTILISIFAILLIFGVTLAWYIDNLDIWGVTFETGYIEFNAYVYDANGKRLVGPVASNEENESKYLNAPLITIQDAQVGSTGTAYIAVESTGSIGIQYKIAFDISGETDSATAYLGGYKYNITKVTDKVAFSNAGDIDVSGCPNPEKISDEMVTIDRNPVNGTIEAEDGYEIYRIDYTLVNKNEEYTDKAIKIYFNIFATQIGGDFENTEERGYTYYCSTKEDIDRAKVEAYAGDIIKLSSDIVYYGDLVFNKPVHLETNDFTLTVNGNLMYDYVLSNDLKINAGGLGKIIVQCTKDGVGGNFTIKAPISDVVLTGSGSSNGDIVVEKKFTVDATSAFGSPGVSFNNIKIVDDKNANKAVLLESNTRATISFGTTIGSIQSVVKANNIEIINNGVIDNINLSNMSLLAQTNSPQIYILNNNDINQAIALPTWSEKFVENESGICTGNTRIIQSISGSPMTVSGTCDFDNADIEIEKKNVLVEQIEENNDSRLKIYYQDKDGQTTTIQSILEDYFTYEATTGCKLSEVLQLEIISIGSKAITNADIAFLNSNNMISLKHLDMHRANMYDTKNEIQNKLPDGAFSGVSKYEKLVLPQNLVEIGSNALANTNIESIITIPADVYIFGTSWFSNGKYVSFASSVPVAQAAAGLSGVKAIFVEEPYIESYKNVYSAYANRIYPVSVMDETKQHFVRNTINDEWEITYLISGIDSVIGENITIDGQILKITSVYDNAYRHNFTGSKVVFADTVSNLGAGNFYSNKSITAVDLNNVKTVGSEAFYSCSILEQVEFGNSLETIGASAFARCAGMHIDVVLPATMQKIGAGAFQQTHITGVDAGGTTSIDGSVFASCADLVYAELPNVEVIGENGNNGLFAGCISLVSVDFSSLTKVYGDKMFSGCTSLREMYMGTRDDGVSLGVNPFVGADIKTLKLFVPEEYLEFFQGKSLGGISATKIYPNGEKMGEVLVNGFNIGEYIVRNQGDNTYALVTSNIDYAGSLIIPTDYNGKPITAIYANAFRNQGFTDVKVEIGNNVVTIGNSAFYGCSGITEIDFGNAVEVIDSYAFAYCSKWAENVVLPAAMERIESNAFSNSGILGINTGGTVSVESNAFSGCTSLVYAVFPEVTVIAESRSNGVFSSCISLVSVDMPKVTRVYGTLMFMGCTSLSEIYLGTKDANVTLGSNTFYGVSTSKIKLFVPEDLVTFYGDKSILSANQVYPRGIKIGDKAINGFVVGDYVLIENDSGYTLVTSNLDFAGDVVIPNEYNNKPITEIYANAFRNQTFTDVSLTLGTNVTLIGNGAFYGTTGLTSVTMDNVTTVDADAFCRSGIKVLNGPSLTSVGNNAFSNCASLGVVNIPRIERIDSTNTFADCNNLKTVYFEDVMYLNATTFNQCKRLEKITINRAIDSNGENMPATMTIDASAPCKIYVPYRSLQYYTNPWSGKPVVSFDLTATYNGDTYVLGETSNGRYALIEFVPSKTVTSLTLPATVSIANVGNVSIYTIQYGAFSTVAGTLKNITLSSSIAQLDNGALSECRVLENIYVNSNNMYFTSISGVLYSKDARMLVKYPVGRSGKFDMTGANYASTIGIGAGAFTNAVGLTEIVFPSSLLVIDSTAFENCTMLQTVTFTGNTPPLLMGSGIFNTNVESFEMVIPTADADVVTAYLCAYNFGEYEPYIDLNGNAAPSSTTPRNQVNLADVSTKQATFAMLKPVKTEENEGKLVPPEDDSTGGDGPDPSEDEEETDVSEAETEAVETTEVPAE